MNTTTKVGFWLFLENELIALLYDGRWMMIAVILCIVVDFRLGWGESHKRLGEAEQMGNHTLMDKYKWHVSRAVRRSINKFFDYLFWICLGMAIGKAAVEPLGVDYKLAGVVATAVIIFCEVSSIFGHFFYLHGATVEKASVRGFFKAFAVALAKRKSEDVGEALEDALEKAESQEASRNNDSTQ